MSERKHFYPILSCQLKVLQCLNIISLKYELYDKGGKAFFGCTTQFF